MKNVEISQTILNCLEFSAIVFSNIASNLQILNLMNNNTRNPNINSDPVSIATQIFDQHPRIIKIRFSIQFQGKQ